MSLPDINLFQLQTHLHLCGVSKLNEHSLMFLEEIVHCKVINMTHRSKQFF